MPKPSRPIINGIKQCPHCEQYRPLSEWGKNASAKDGYSYRCYHCQRASQRKWRKANHEQHRDGNAAWRAKPGVQLRINAQLRARRFGKDLPWLEQFLADNPNCPLCGAPGEHIDHCHETDEVRGHLCGHCNKGLGYFRDNPATLTAAAAYLIHHKG